MGDFDKVLFPLDGFCGVVVLLIIFVSGDVVVGVIPLLPKVVLVAAISIGPSLSASSSIGGEGRLVLFERLMTVENNVVVVFGEFLCIGDDGDASLSLLPLPLPPLHFFLEIN